MLANSTLYTAVLAVLLVPFVVLISALAFTGSITNRAQLIIVGVVVLLFASLVNAKSYEFKFKGGYTVVASDYTTAARLCFSGLTQGKWQGEDRSLEIIDVCANPTMPKDYPW